MNYLTKRERLKFKKKMGTENCYINAQRYIWRNPNQILNKFEVLRFTGKCRVINSSKVGFKEMYSKNEERETYEEDVTVSRI